MLTFHTRSLLFETTRRRIVLQLGRSPTVKGGILPHGGKHRVSHRTCWQIQCQVFDTLEKDVLLLFQLLKLDQLLVCELPPKMPSNMIISGLRSRNTRNVASWHQSCISKLFGTVEVNVVIFVQCGFSCVMSWLCNNYFPAHLSFLFYISSLFLFLIQV